MGDSNHPHVVMVVVVFQHASASVAALALVPAAKSTLPWLVGPRQQHLEAAWTVVVVVQEVPLLLQGLWRRWTRGLALSGPSSMYSLPRRDQECEERTVILAAVSFGPWALAWALVSTRLQQ